MFFSHNSKVDNKKKKKPKRTEEIFVVVVVKAAFCYILISFCLFFFRWGLIEKIFETKTENEEEEISLLLLLLSMRRKITEFKQICKYLKTKY